MVIGVTTGFTRTLEIYGRRLPRHHGRAERLVLALGFSHPVDVDAAAGGVSFAVEGGDPHRRHRHRQGAGRRDRRPASARVRKPEPYKGKGIRYSDEVSGARLARPVKRRQEASK